MIEDMDSANKHGREGGERREMRKNKKDLNYGRICDGLAGIIWGR
jgi:hypothetical protein